ncbi:MAG: NAD-dependent epimerase/dehydratase family protein [Flavobacteriaceae bacterium]|nr:NAD-dependent epimerase/dehydratase family protein [Flavobacteriaceae bacterium]
MKILVTGAAGFIGSHAAERLHDLEHEVIGLDNFSPYYSEELKQINAGELRKKNIQLLECDLREPISFKLLPKDFDVVIHFAAHPGISESSTFDDYLSNNIVGTKNLLDFVESFDIQPYFINIATSSIYGAKAAFDETTIPKPTSLYGVTKLAAEQLVLAKVRLNQLQGCSLRLYSVYGPRERPDKLYTKLISCGLKGEAFPLFPGSLEHLRSFTYVQDIVDGIVSVLDRFDACNGEIINLGTEEENTTLTGIQTVEEILGKAIQMNHLTSKRSGDQLRTKAVINKARNLLNYNPQTSLKKGLQHQVEWYQATFLKKD